MFSCRRAILLSSLLLLPACSTTKPLEPFPGQQIQPTTPTSTIRETDHVLIDTVDGGPSVVSKFSLGLPLQDTTYHQYKIPSGTHTLYVLYQIHNGAVKNSDPVPVDVTLLPNHTYHFDSNSSKFFMTGPLPIIPHWNPALIDDATNKVVASAVPLPPAK
ncbi:MAG TPA: hypothetical protein VFE58_17625 [Tepidisphaeraceae bacterium]|nr:hypothetical protein [Tepidisphaeraceae bacterium]